MKSKSISDLLDDISFKLDGFDFIGESLSNSKGNITFNDGVASLILNTTKGIQADIEECRNVLSDIMLKLEKGGNQNESDD